MGPRLRAGTGKTLIARQIGKMLNGKEPKVGGVHGGGPLPGGGCACARAHALPRALQLTTQRPPPLPRL